MFEFRNLDWDEDTLVQNTWYTALATTEDVKAWYIVVEQTNNGAAVETIEVELTIDGTVYTETLVGLASGTPMYLTFLYTGVLASQALVIQVLSRDNDQSAPLETRSLQIRVRQTTPVDPVAAQIEVNMVYATKEET